MGENSGIEWTHHTFNPVWGCSKVSAGCANCYAEGTANRWGFDVWGKDKPRRTFGDAHWDEPVKWNREAEAAGERRRVFCASMADVFEDHPTTAAQLPRLWDLIRRTPMLDWLLLTKRPERIKASLPEDWWNSQRAGPGYANVWLGTSVESQDVAIKRIAHLISVPARVRFLSCEPLLGPLSIRHLIADERASGLRRDVQWVIVGGESGPGARPMDLMWARDLRDQVQPIGVAFFFKQTGKVAALVSAKGGTVEDIPADLLIRDFPAPFTNRPPNGTAPEDETVKKCEVCDRPAPCPAHKEGPVA